ncbi:MAG: hypothetical protein AVO35_10355 [Candidatus Aegiribacteria sp. MLS_C]|nr:MAG: hypothetical protein AVO35_10355 [Candidatus Aegiribacteria sp. MLS_C]
MYKLNIAVLCTLAIAITVSCGRGLENPPPPDYTSIELAEQLQIWNPHGYLWKRSDDGGRIGVVTFGLKNAGDYDIVDLTLVVRVYPEFDEWILPAQVPVYHLECLQAGHSEMLFDLAVIRIDSIEQFLNDSVFQDRIADYDAYYFTIEADFGMGDTHTVSGALGGSVFGFPRGRGLLTDPGRY